MVYLLSLDDIFVNHLHKSQTPTILHNEECYSLSYDTLGFCARGGQMRRLHVVVRCRPTVYSMMKKKMSNILHVITLET